MDKATVNELRLMASRLGRIRKSLTVTQSFCTACGRAEYDSFELHRAKESLGGAINRIEKAIDDINTEIGEER